MGIVAAALATGAAAASGTSVAVVVVPTSPLERYAKSGAVGLLVPGSGATVTRRGALAALERGKVESALLGGVPGGRPLIRLAQRPGPITIYVSLPPAGKHHNVRRYPIAIVGGGYRGMLTSTSTRIDGLVSIADVAPTAQALERGERPVIRSRTDADAPSDLRSLDRRLSHAHDLRTWAEVILVVSILLLLWGRAALLVPVAALSAALVLSAAGATRAAVVLPLLAVATIWGSLFAARRAVLAIVAFFVAFLIVMAAWPEVNSLAVIGPHPDGGGRFYGVTNQVETLLLAPALAAATVLGPLAVAVLSLVVIGWSKAGADGGGAIVFASAFAVLALRQRLLAMTPVRLAISGAVACLLVLALIGLDAVTGGSSHVTRAAGGGPGSVFTDVGHRLHVSYEGATSSWHALTATLGCLAVLALIATARPRYPTVDAFLVAIVVSLLVNDTPTDVAAFGALACLALLRWERVRRRALQ